MSIRNTSLVLLLVCWMIPFGAGLTAQSPDELFLEINGESYSTWYFTKSYIHHLRTTGLNDTREERYGHLDVLINEILLAQQAEKKNLSDDDEKVFRNKTEKKLRADIFYNRAFMDTLSLPDDIQVRDAFFKSKMKIFASHLFFTDEDKAEAYFQRIKDGESFTDLANELYDTAVYDSLAGYLGEMSYFSVDADVAEILFDMRAGQISQPVRSRFGYHIFRVEERVANPLITEAEFQYRYNGITDQEKRRILAMKGDRFVRDYMSSLRISVDTAAARQLYSVLANIGVTRPDDPLQQAVPRESISDSEIQTLREQLSPQTEIATYEHLGQIRTFTVADYLFWLEFLPLSEAKYRTMASIGRALRNEVFAEAAEQMDLEEDKDYQFEVSYHMDNYKSWRMKTYLLNQEKVPVPEEVLKQAFNDYGLNRVKEVRFTGWTIRAESFEDARSAKNQIEAGERKPEEIKGYRSYQNEDVQSAYDLRSHLFRVVPGSISIAQTPENYYLMRVDRRDIKRNSFAEMKQEVEKRMGNSYNIAHTLRTLKTESEIRVDSTIFEELMEHFNDPALRGQ